MSLQQIKLTILKFLQNYGLQERPQIQQMWETTFQQAAQHTSLAGFSRGKLKIIVDSPVWKQQLSLTKKEIIKKLNNKLKKEIIKEIEVSIGEINNETKD